MIYEDYKQQGVDCAIQHVKGDTGEWNDGEVFTPFGVVSVYSERQTTPAGKRNDYESYGFVWGGRYYSRRGNRYRTKIGLARIAARLIKEVVFSNAPEKGQTLRGKPKPKQKKTASRIGR